MLRCGHSEKLQSPAPSVRKKLLTGQTTLTSGFAAPLGPKSARATEITRCICVFMAKDMRPFSVVENEGFRLLVNTLEPRYTIPSHPHFSQTMAALYRETKSKVVETLRKADSNYNRQLDLRGYPKLSYGHRPCDNQRVGDG